ncbi:SOS response-associated peptidase [Sphingomicrobium astaxanthinifaciens]|uniref:SOS response-associated peptidase n=1 Tax=Sphingomicrobium astaxanthinifaciens TaxID=1227949 RepID=UPI001FCAB27D|nr:SOS response-associated peptidase family protein [Sphingomicrobium astaxanthinifaciens]MCJ7421853.1 SOS response-associated peptidase family protein [Sphingomicrobium astaxanthinifaciens]
MCNLYRMTASVDEMKQLFGSFAGERANLAPREEIFPKYAAPVLRRDVDGLALEEMEWGFPGPKAAGGRPVTNVRNLASPFWRSALANPERRCLVPVTRFSEWSQEPDPATGRKVKHWFGLAARGEGDRDAPFAFAGLWRPGEERSYYAFLTCPPNAMVGAVHPKAMPVMLDPRDYDRWLHGSTEEACALARPYPDDKMTQFA